MDLELFFIIISVLVTGGLAISAHLSSKKKDAFINKKTEEIVNLQNKLNVKSDKLIEVQEELLKYSSGGDSFGEVELLRISDGKDDFYETFYFSNKGEYPLYDVSVTVLDRNQLDLDAIKKRDGLATVEDIQKYKTYKLGNIGVNGGTTFNQVFTIPKNLMQDYLFSINTKNGHFSQQLKFIAIDNTLLKATKINTIDTTGKKQIEILVEKVDENFPGVKEGKIDWE